MEISSRNYFEAVNDDTKLFEYGEISDWSSVRGNQPFILVENEIRDNVFRVYNDHLSDDPREIETHYASHVWPAGVWILKEKQSE